MAICLNGPDGIGRAAAACPDGLTGMLHLSMCRLIREQLAAAHFANWSVAARQTLNTHDIGVCCCYSLVFASSRNVNASMYSTYMIYGLVGMLAL